MHPEYKILKARTLDDLEREASVYISEGWEPFGVIGETHDCFYREVVRFPRPTTTKSELDDVESKFNERKEAMDSYVKDLLFVNNIDILCQGGKFFTVYSNKITEGISPTQIVQLLKQSKHCPIGLDEKRVIEAIEGIV